MGKRVGAYLRELRQQQGMSMRELGRALNLSPAHISLLEKGHREASLSALYPLVQKLQGDFGTALRLLALDAGIPEEALRGSSSESPQ